MAVIPTLNAQKIKLPYEKQPSAASPYVNTAPDVKTSEQISKGSPVPTQTTPVATVPGTSVPNNTSPTTPIPGAKASATGVSTAAPSTAATPRAAATTTSVPAAPTPAAPVATVTTPGAPPGTPATTPLAPTPKSIVIGTAAEQAKEEAENEEAQKRYEAGLLQTEQDEAIERQAEGSLRGLTGRM